MQVDVYKRYVSLISEREVKRKSGCLILSEIWLIGWSISMSTIMSFCMKVYVYIRNTGLISKESLDSWSVRVDKNQVREKYSGVPTIISLWKGKGEKEGGKVINIPGHTIKIKIIISYYSEVLGLQISSTAKNVDA